MCCLALQYNKFGLVILQLHVSSGHWISGSMCFEFLQEEEGEDNKKQQESILSDAADKVFTDSHNVCTPHANKHDL